MSLKIGLTGGICSGKTAVSDWFQHIGIPIIDADIVSRQVVAPGSRALEQIVDEFGQAVLLDDGSLNRKALRSIVFDDTDKRIWLERLLHPLVRKSMLQQTSEVSAPYCILSIPLLVETNFVELVDRIAVVDVPRHIQIARLTARDGITQIEAEKILGAQASREQRLAIADDVIDNSGDWQALHQQLHGLHEKYLALENLANG